MATVNFFRIMLGLPSLKITSTDPGIIPCDGGSLNATGGTGNFNFRAITVGEGIGFVDTTWNAIGQIDRFQIIWNNQIVADSLFVGDTLSSNPSNQISDLATALNDGFQENNWNDQTQTFDSTGNTIYPNINNYPTTACLWEGGESGTDDRIVYNIAPTGSLYDRNDNSGQTPSGTGGNAPSQGYYENANGQGLAAPASGCPASDYKQIGVVADYPNSNSKSWDGDIKLQFYKDAQYPEIIELRVWGTGGTAWSLSNLTCPGGGYGEIVGMATKLGTDDCTNYGSYGNSITGTFPWNGFSYSNQTFFYDSGIGSSSALEVGDTLYYDQQLSNPQSLRGIGGANLGYVNINNNIINPKPNTYFSTWSNTNGTQTPEVPGYQAYNEATNYIDYRKYTSTYFNNVIYTGSNAGVITNITNTYQWKETVVKYAGIGNGPFSVNCGLTASLTPDTTYYFNSQRNNGCPGYGDFIYTGDPGQPTGTNLSPWGEYPDNSLNSILPTEGWYVVNTNSGCRTAGMPDRVLIYVTVRGGWSRVAASPMGFNNSPCFQ